MGNLRLGMAVLGLTSLMTGCSTSPGLAGADSAPEVPPRVKALSPGDPVNGLVRFFGYLDVIREPSDNSQEMEARFGHFDAEVPASTVLKAFSLETPDACQRSSRANPIEIADELAFPGHPYQFVDAGDAITIKHDNRRYASLSRKANVDGPEYETAVSGVAASIAKFKVFDVFVRTDNLSATIPGAVFPAIGPLKIPAVSDVSGFNLGPEDSVRADTVFEWKAGDNPHALVQISAGGGGRAIFCSAVDDGQFALPQEIKQWLGNNTIPRPAAHREAVVFYQTDNALIAITQSTHY